MTEAAPHSSALLHFKRSPTEKFVFVLDAKAEAGMSHIELARWADLILIAPCTANTWRSSHPTSVGSLDHSMDSVRVC